MVQSSNFLVLGKKGWQRQLFCSIPFSCIFNDDGKVFYKSFDVLAPTP
jgi:hypothetical protein